MQRLHGWNALGYTNPSIGSHPVFVCEISRGKPRIPHLLVELKREPDDWFWALPAITGANSGPEQTQGKLQDRAVALI
jgi:hypothetical protein